MEVRHSAPRSLGVEQLMYVGDDGIGVDPPVAAGPNHYELLLGAGCALAVIFGKKTHPLLRAACGVVAGGVAYSYVQSR